MDYETFYQSCLPQMSIFKEKLSMKYGHTSEITPLAATLDKLVFVRAPAPGDLRIVICDHDGNDVEAMFNNKPVDLDLVVEQMTYTYYLQMGDTQKILETEQRLLQKRQMVERVYHDLFSLVPQVLYGHGPGMTWGWNGQTTTQVHPYGTLISWKDDQRTIEIPIQWYTMPQEEALEILWVCRRYMRLKLTEAIRLPPSLACAWTELENLTYRFRHFAVPEIDFWVDDRRVPHACAMGVTATGRRGHDTSEAIENLVKEIASKMPYHEKMQPRMVEVLIVVCRTQKDECVRKVVDLIPNTDLRESVMEQIRKVHQ